MLSIFLPLRVPVKNFADFVLNGNTYSSITDFFCQRRINGFGEYPQPLKDLSSNLATKKCSFYVQLFPFLNCGVHTDDHELSDEVRLLHIWARDIRIASVRSTTQFESCRPFPRRYQASMAKSFSA